jgi:hypothetical protein
MIQSAHTSTQNLKMTSIHRSKKFCNSFQTLTTLHTPHKKSELSDFNHGDNNNNEPIARLIEYTTKMSELSMTFCRVLIISFFIVIKVQFMDEKKNYIIEKK